MYPLKTKYKYNPADLASTANTYTTIYLGNYVSGDFSEGHGSHPGVDIMPITPNDLVFACLDGVVQIAASKASEGNYVIIRHDNVPDPSNLEKKATLYSCYLHLSEYSVSVGQLVEEGDVIGKTGNTGNSTGEHLHFQIDRNEALFHPYWPFTFAQANAAGLGFFDAVNKGLGLEDARKFTVNPLVYLDQVAGYNSESVVVSSTLVASIAPVTNTAPVAPSKPVQSPPPVADTPSGFSDVPSDHPYRTAIDFLKDKNVVAGSNGQFFPDATITRAELLKMVFGAAGTTLASNGANYFSDIDPASWQASYANTAKANGIIGGYSDGTFRPNNPITRAEAFKIIINTFHTEALDMVSFPVFADVPVSTWYAPYALFAQTNSLIDFSLNLFEPDKLMNRGEVANAIYMLMKR
ncbi:MAG: S-layer homology domain-containing protein [Candidatus Gracilibacteria bacterium]|nr:S-layer homology domain-containing protein [Candidatus Gracilibacteria bacterium]